MSLSFAEALDGFEARLAAIERALESGSWDEVPAWSAPRDALGHPEPGDVERLEALLARAEDCRARLISAMSDAVEVLRAGRASRAAARGYLGAPR